MRSFEMGMSASAVCMNQYKNTQKSPAATIESVKRGYPQGALLLTVYASVLREMIRKVDEAWPNRFDAAL